MDKRVLQDISDFIFMDDSLEKADIIFIPGGSHPELGEYAAKLWHEGYAPYIMPSGGVSIKSGKFNGVKTRQDIYNLDYKTDCEFLVDVLIKNGVDKSAIIEENTSGYTKENAYFSRKVVDENHLNINKAILCCKSFHGKRSFLCYQFAFPGTQIMVHSIPYIENGIEITKNNWFLSEIGIKRALGELQRCGNQFTEEYNIYGGYLNECIK